MKKSSQSKSESGLQNFQFGATAGMPKYLQLRNSLGAAISEGKWKAGGKLPPEDTLTQATGLSLGTVQRALQTLADDGIVVRRQGIGTFVTRTEKPMNAPFYHCRFLDDQGRQLPIFSRVLRRQPATESGEWNKHLRGRKVVCIERLFSVNKEFKVYTHLYLDAARYPTLAQTPVSKMSGVNFKDLMAREYHVPLTRFTENLSVRVFTPTVCKALGVARATSGAVVEIVAQDGRGDPIYFQDLHIPPTQRRLFIV